MKIALGSDHGGYELKEHIAKHLENIGHEVLNLGTYSEDSVDYPVYGQKVAEAVVAKEAEVGIIMCGTGLGISMAASKVSGTRVAVVSDEYSARMARVHNNANVLSMGGRVVGKDLAISLVEAFLNAEFEGGRHQRRIDIITSIEEKYNK